MITRITMVIDTITPMENCGQPNANAAWHAACVAVHDVHVLHRNLQRHMVTPSVREVERHLEAVAALVVEVGVVAAAALDAAEGIAAADVTAAICCSMPASFHWADASASSSTKCQTSSTG